MRKNISVYCDGGARGNPGKGASAFVLFEGNVLKHEDGVFLKHTTNNFAEYSAVLLALKYLIKNYNDSNYSIVFLLDSELVVKQINGLYKVKNEKIKHLYNQVIKQLAELKVTPLFVNIKRNKNYFADKLVNKIIDENI